MKILLVEDDKDLALTVQYELQKHFVVDIAYTGEDGEYQAHINEYDLILLDLILPDINGMEVCQKLRENGIKTPIIMLTGQYDVDKKIESLNCGADDYIVKPFNFDELLARIRAILRRSLNLMPSNILKAHDLYLDVVKKKVFRKGKEIMLRRKEFDLLEYLMRNAGKVLTRNMILEHVWDTAYDLANNTVDVHIKYLRDKVDKGSSKKLLKTVHGFGYKLEL